jgi:hypothetical protein
LAHFIRPFAFARAVVTLASFGLSTSEFKLSSALVGGFALLLYVRPTVSCVIVRVDWRGIACFSAGTVLQLR